MHLQHFFHAVPWLLHQNQRKLAVFEPWIVAFQPKQSEPPFSWQHVSGWHGFSMILTFILGDGEATNRVCSSGHDLEREIYILYKYIYLHFHARICAQLQQENARKHVHRAEEFWVHALSPAIASQDQRTKSAAQKANFVIRRNKSLWNGKTTFTTDINWLRVFQCDLCLILKQWQSIPCTPPDFANMLKTSTMVRHCFGGPLAGTDRWFGKCVGSLYLISMPRKQTCLAGGFLQHVLYYIVIFCSAHLGGWSGLTNLFKKGWNVETTNQHGKLPPRISCRFASSKLWQEKL